MRKLFSLLIILPLIVNIEIPVAKWSWDWDFNFDWDFDELINKFKNLIPDFINKMQSTINNFIEKTEEQKNEFLKDLDKKISSLQEKIKNKVDEKKEDIKELVEKATEAAKCLSHKICNIAGMEDEECRNDKKKLLSNLLGAVKDNLGECSVIVETIGKLTEKAELDLKYFLFLVESLTENPDAIDKGKSQIIYDIMNCLQDKFEDIWQKVNGNIEDQEISINTKEMITNILLKSYSNLVNVIRFEEIDGFIKKANEKTGLISDDQAKKIHQGIFNVLKKYNQFKSGFYNISANLNLNIIKKSDNLDINGEVNIDTDKGIKIKLKSQYLLSEKGGETIQAVLFDSPLVSLRTSSEKEGGTSNIFVGITLYDKNGNEILVKDFNTKDLRPEIFFKKKLYNAMTTCLFYNEAEDKIENKGIDTFIETFDGEEYIKCIPQHLSSFTIGSYDSSSIGVETKEEKSYAAIIAIACSIGAIALLVGGFFLYRYLRRRSNK